MVLPLQFVVETLHLNRYTQPLVSATEFMEEKSYVKLQTQLVFNSTSIKQQQTLVTIS